MTDGQSGYSSSQVNNALAKYEKITEYDGNTSVDANTLNQQGIYRMKATYTGTATNFPTWNKPGGAILEVHNMGTYCTQRFIPYGDDTIVYIRKKSYGNGEPNYKWTQWIKEVTESELNVALANCSFNVSGNKLIIQNSSYEWEFTGSAK